MGKVLSVMSRKARRFNAENRAHRLLDKEKLEAAPKFQSNLDDFQRVLRAQPDFAQQEGKKHSELDNRLKQVYVTSTDPPMPNVTRERSNEEKPLPLNKKQVPDFEFGYLEPEKVLLGHATLRQVLKFIGDHQIEPEKWTGQKISDEYKLNSSIVDNILKNFHTFEVYIPESKSEDKILLTQRIKNMWNEEPQLLPPPTFKKDDDFDRLLKEHEEIERKKKEKH